jgi:ParB family chromosome partitioning protein
MSKQGLPKSRLGRGLSSLINISESPAAAAGVVPSGVGSTDAPAAVLSESGSSALPPGVLVVELPVDQISPNPHQPRRRFDEGPLKELAESIKSTGLIQPIVARGTPDGGYELIAGERRWRAAKLAGLAALPVILRSVDPVMQAQMALVENIQRQDLNPIERATAYKALLDNLGLTQGELADRLGEDRSVIGHFLRLLDLTPAVQEFIADGRLSVSHGKLLAGVSDVSEQIRLAELAINQGLNVRNLERLLNVPGATPPPAPQKSPSAHLADLEKSLSRQLGMRVQVRAGRQKGRGRLVVHYGSLDQFDDLLSRLGMAAE